MDVPDAEPEFHDDRDLPANPRHSYPPGYHPVSDALTSNEPIREADIGCIGDSARDNKYDLEACLLPPGAGYPYPLPKYDVPFPWNSTTSINSLPMQGSEEAPWHALEQDGESTRSLWVATSDDPDDEFLLSYGSEDPHHPFNWSTLKKWTVLLTVCSGAVCVTVASSIQASTYTQLEDQFDIPRIEAVAGVTLYVLGFGIGARE
jgi:hypothetical protein